MTLRERPAAVLESWEPELLLRSYDVVGDVAVIRVPKIIEHRTKEIAEAVMQNNERVRVVLRQVSPVSGNLRLRGLS